MNNNQKLLSILALAAFIGSVLFAPWETEFSAEGTTFAFPTRYSPLWAPPQAPAPAVGNAPSVGLGAVKLRTDSLVTEWAAIAIVYAVVFALLKKQPLQSS